MNTAQLLSIQVGPTKIVVTADATDKRDPVWTTATFKEPVSGPIWLGKINLAGDDQADRENHGGPDKAVNVYSADHFPAWAAELGRELPPPGCFSENFTISGLTENDAAIGDIFSVGDAIVQIAQPRVPCWKLARRWGVHDMIKRVSDSNRTGWLMRVLQEGFVEAGQPFVLTERLLPQWTIARVNDIFYNHSFDPDTLELAESSLMPAYWGDILRQRYEKALAKAH